jgi:osmotically-inducible protein OsmY
MYQARFSANAALLIISVCDRSMNRALGEVFCASPSAGSERKFLMSDKTLGQTIVEELDFEPSVDAASIGVAVDNGVVPLTRRVAGYAEKVAPERAIQRVQGVRVIAEKIEVRYPNDKETADDQIAERTLTVAIEARARSRIRASRLERFRELSAPTRSRA